jgi:hypothetical protein
MIPISRVVNASLVSSASDPLLPSDSILIKWRPVTAAAAGIGSWDNGGGNHTIIMTPVSDKRLYVLSSGLLGW